MVQTVSVFWKRCINPHVTSVVFEISFLSVERVFVLISLGFFVKSNKRVQKTEFFLGDIFKAYLRNFALVSIAATPSA